MALTDLTRISTSGIATGSTIDAAILRKDVSFRGSQVGVTSALFDSSDNALEFNNNVKLKLGNSGNFSLYSDGVNGILYAQNDPLYLKGEAVYIQTNNNEASGYFLKNGAVKLYFNGGDPKFETTSTGAVVTGILTASSFSGGGGISAGVVTCTGLDLNGNGDVSGNFVIGGDLTVNGTTTTLDTNLTEVDRIEVGANSNTLAGIAVTQSGSGDILRLYDGASQVVTVDDEGNVGLGINSPSNAKLQVHGGIIKISGHAYARVTINDGANEAFFGFENQGPLLIGNANADAQIRVQGTNDIFFQTGNTVKRLTIKGDTGNIGIGTDNPASKLHIHHPSTSVTQILECSNGAAQFNIKHTNGYGSVDFSYQGTQKWRVGQTGQFSDFSIWQASGVGSGHDPYRFAIKNSGNVGVSTHTPREIFHVNKPTGTACVLVSSPTAPQIRFNPNATDTTDADRTIFGQATGNSQFVNSAVSGDTVLRGTSTGSIKFGIGNNEKVRITSSGNLEIINNNDYLKIGAGGALSMVFTGGQSYITNSTGHLTGRSASYTWENVDGTAEYLRIASDGKIGINEVNPQQQLHIHEDTIYNGILINGSNAPRIGFARQTTTTGEWSVGIDGTNGNQFAINNSNNNSNRKFIISSSQISLLDTTQVEGDFKVINAGNSRVEIETQSARTVFRGSSGIAIFGETGQNNNANLNLYPTGTAVYANLIFNNAAGNGYASIIAHEGQSLFFTSGTNGPLRFRVNGSGFHSFQDGNTDRVRITAGGNVNIGTSELSQTDRLLNVYGGRMRVTYTGPGNSIELMNNASSGNSYGLLCSSGTTSGDYNAEFRQQNGTSILRIRGDGNIGIKNGSPFNRFCVGGHTFTGGDAMYANDRVGMSNHGNLTGLMLASTYNDSTHPEYGLVFVQGPSTSSYNAWSVSPDGPAKGDSLNFHYGGYSGSGGRPNIHNPSFKKFEMNGDGNFHITDGNLKLADGHGIDFSATGDAGTGASTNNELFDDYEEGSWNASSLNYDYDGNQAQRGFYVKIGRMVYAYYRVKFHTQSNHTGNHMRWTQLPFTADSGSPQDVIVGAHAHAYGSVDFFRVYVQPGTTYAYWYTSTGQNFNNSTNMNGADVRGCIMYKASS